MDKTEKWLLGIAFVLLGVALFLNLGIFPFYNEEPRRALIALEMLYHDNFIVPTELGEYYYKKPPLYNWLVVGAFKIFGIGSEFGMRSISVVSLLLMGALTFWFVRKYANTRLAVYSALFFIISGDIFFYFSLSGEIDIFYSLVTYASIIFAFHFYEQQKPLALYLTVCSLTAIGFLTKGLPSLVFSILTLSVLFFYKKRFWSLISWQHVVGIAAFCVITGAYFYAYSFYNDPLNYYHDLWGQSSRRTVLHTGFTPLLLHLVKFPFVVMKDLLPVSVFLLLIFRKGAWKSIWESELLKFCVIIFLVNIAVYWISPGTRSRYHYMLYPFLAIVCTHLLLEFVKEKRIQRFSPLWLILLVVAARIIFDIIVLPVRATTGEHVQFKKDAEKIAAHTQGNNLYLYKFYGDGTYSLGNAFYLDLARKDVLTIKQERNCDDFFIVYDIDAPGHTWQVFYEFTWRTNHYYLVKFTDCGGNG